MLRNGRWRLFLNGALCGMIFMAVIGGALIWWKSRPERSADDNAIYDNCLMERDGNTVACDAMMRVVDRGRAAESMKKAASDPAEEAMKEDAAKLLAAGFSKREVVKWAMGKGFGGSQVSDAVGISLKELQAGRY